MSVSAPERFVWIARARGIGIMLVVVGHCLRGLVRAGILPADAMTAAIDRAIYSFHMPLFFFLSGLTFAASAGRQTVAGFLSGRMVRLLWPLFLWTWIFFALQALAGDSINSAPEPFPWFPLPPRLHFWFLWALLLIHLTVFTALRGGVAGVAAAVAAVVTGYILLRSQPSAFVWIGPALYNLVFFLTGLAASGGGWIPRLVGGEASAGRAAFGGAIFLCAVGWATFGPLPFGLGAALAIAAIVGLVLVVAQVFRAGPVSDFLVLCGRMSMLIYLAHTIFSAGIRIGLVSAGITAWPAHLLLGILAGMAGPMVLSELARRGGFSHMR